MALCGRSIASRHPTITFYLVFCCIIWVVWVDFCFCLHSCDQKYSTFDRFSCILECCFSFSLLSIFCGGGRSGGRPFCFCLHSCDQRYSRYDRFPCILECCFSFCLLSIVCVWGGGSLIRHSLLRSGSVKWHVRLLEAAWTIECFAHSSLCFL